MLMNLCKYTVEDIQVIFRDGSKELIPKNNVTNIIIQKTFNENFFPILNLKATMNKKLYNKILQNNDTVLFNVKISKFLIKNNTTVINKTFSKNIIDLMFSLVTDGTPVEEHSLEENIPDIKTSPEKDSMEGDFFLFIKDHIHRYRKRFNFIARDTNMATVITYLAHMYNIKNLLMSDPENSQTYSEIPILPYTFIGQLEYLQKIYGIYNNGYTLFNDFDVVYLLNNSASCTALRYNEVERVYVNVADIDEHGRANVGCYYNKNNNSYNINVSKRPTIKNNEDEIKETLYDKIIFIDTANGSKITKDLNMKTDGMVKIYDNRYSNNYAINEYVSSLNRSKISVFAVFNEIEFDLITPNKTYYFNLEADKTAKKYSNIYKLNNAIINLYRDNKNEYFSCAVECNFKNV